MSGASVPPARRALLVAGSQFRDTPLEALLAGTVTAASAWTDNPMVPGLLENWPSVSSTNGAPMRRFKG